MRAFRSAVVAVVLMTTVAGWERDAGAQVDTVQAGSAWSYERFQTWEYVATVGVAAAGLGALAIPVGTGRWKGENVFDASVRSSLRPADRGDRRTAADASDVLLALTMNQMLFDALAVSWAARGQPDVAFQMSLIGLEAIGFTTGVTALVKATAARERPYGVDCARDADIRKTDACEGRERYLSFFSGHTSVAFTAASVTCMHHAHMPLYGGGWADRMGCIGAYGAAGAVGAMRVLADDHHASDVLSGAVLGTAAGLGLPWLLHYRHPRRPVSTGGDHRRAASSVSIRLAPAPNGGSILGEF